MKQELIISWKIPWLVGSINHPPSSRGLIILELLLAPHGGADFEPSWGSFIWPRTGFNYWRVPWLCADARQVVWCQDWRLKAIVVQYWPTGLVVWSHTIRLLKVCLIIPETVLCYYLSLSTLPTIRTTLDITFCGVLGDMKELHLVETWHTSSVVSCH